MMSIDTNRSHRVIGQHCYAQKRKLGLRLRRIIGMFALIMLTWIIHGQTVVVPEGSYIINMSVQPQTVRNAIKPYGLVWHLIHEHNVPVIWSIKSGKAKDGVDFSYDGTDFKAGPFIITAPYRNSEINELISTWEAKGVVGLTTNTEITVPLYKVISYSMNWTLDHQNGQIAEAYLNSAEIPETAYNWVLPEDLTCCNDVFAMPHAEPEWQSHRRILSWNSSIESGGCQGAIWAGCKAVSEMENIYNPNQPSEKMNFLMEDAVHPKNNPAVWANEHDDGSLPPPYQYFYHDHPIMQFIGVMDKAQENGAEQVYLPTNQWRTTTKIGVLDHDHPDVPSLSPGPAAKVAFGHAFGDTTRGYVVYEAGHRVNKKEKTYYAAAQRVFFNFAFMAVGEKAIQPSASIPSEMENGNVYNLTSSATGGSGSYFFHWETDCAGEFTNPYSSNTTFIPSVVSTITECFIKVSVTDDCGTRVGFYNMPVTILPAPAPPIALNDYMQALPGTNVDVFPLTNDFDLNMDPIFLNQLIGPLETGNGTFTNNLDGSVSYISSFEYLGIDTIRYMVCDTTPIADGGPLCDTATIYIDVNWIDENGCYPDEYYGYTKTGYADVKVSSNSVYNYPGALGEPILVENSYGYYAKMDNSGDYLVVDLSDTITTIDSIEIYFGSDDGNYANLQVSGTLNGTDYSGGSDFFDIISGASYDDLYNADPEQDTIFYQPVSGSIRYLRFRRLHGKPGINGVSYKIKGCVSSVPIAVDDYAIVCEDNTININIGQNDIDPQNLSLLTSVTVPPKHGSYTIAENGDIVYAPNIDYSGGDTLTYEVCNPANLCAKGKVYINIIDDGCPIGEYRLNGGPLDSVGDNFPTNYYNNNTGSVNWSTNWVEYNDNVKCGSGYIGVYNGYLEIIDKTGRHIYRTADLSNSIEALLSFEVKYHDLGSSSKIAVQASNNGGNSFTTLRTFDNNSPTTSVEIFDLIEALGSVGSNTIIRFKATSGNLGKKIRIDNVKIVYQLAGCTGDCLQIPYYPPSANDDYEETLLNTPIKVEVQQNDVDPSGLGLTTTIGNISPSNGQINLSGLAIDYLPNPSFVGSDTFNYIICNNFGCDTALVLIDVTCVNPGFGNGISGSVFEDKNQDQFFNLVEKGLDSILVFLYNDVDSSGTVTPVDIKLDSMFTENGNYSFQVNEAAPSLVGDLILKSNSITKPIVSGMDDVEEEGPDGNYRGSGSIYTNSSDIEITEDSGSGSPGTQVIGLRFTKLDIPQGATITSAQIGFRSASADYPNSNSSTANFVIKAEASDDAPGFNTNRYNVSNRTTTVNTAVWTPGSWNSNVDYLTSNLKSVVQEVTDRPGWKSGNDMVFTITGTGSRSSYSYNGCIPHPPVLIVNYDAPLDPGKGTALWSDSSTPETRGWNSNSFEASKNTKGLGQRLKIMTAKHCPIRDEKILAGIGTSGNILAQVSDGSNWTNSSLNPIATVSQTQWWGVDVAYEQLSGDAIMVWNAAPYLKYSIWDGSTWSTPTNISTPITGEAKQIKMASSPGRDEIALVVGSTGGDYALIWNGNAWGNGIQLDQKASNNDFTDVNIVYEQQSGRAMAVYGRSTGTTLEWAIHYRIWDGSQWSSAQYFQPSPYITINSRLKWSMVASDPNSNRIGFTGLTTASDSWAAIWDGTNWGELNLFTTYNSSASEPNVAPAFESRSGDGIFTYGKYGSKYLYYKTWKASSGWSSSKTGPCMSVPPNSMVAFPNFSNDHVMLAVQDDYKHLKYVLWNGASWGTRSIASCSTGETKNQPFTFVWNPIPVKPVIPRHFVMQVDSLNLPQSLHFITDNVETATFLGSGEIDCLNDFGLASHLPPIALPDTAYVDYGSTHQIEVVLNDHDPEGTDLDAFILTSPNNGSVVNNQNGTFSFSSSQGFQGTETFYYYIQDQGVPNLFDTSTVTVIVDVFYNDPPEAMDDYDTTIVNNSIVVDVVNNDFDQEFGTLHVLVDNNILQPTNGIASVFTTHKIEYIPNPQFTGDDVFEYIVCDDQIPSLCDTAKVFIHVLNRPPDAKNDYVVTQTNIAIPIDVLYNDVEGDGHDIIIMGMGTDWQNNSTCKGGNVSINDNGTPLNTNDDFCNYVPPFSFAGLDSFRYEIMDSGTPSFRDSALVVVHITPLIDLELNKNANVNYAPVGDEVIFTSVLTNQGPARASEILVKDYMPKGYTILSNNGNGDFDPLSGVWYIDTLEVFESVSLNITVQVEEHDDHENATEVIAANEKDTDSTPNNDTGNHAEDDEDAAMIFTKEIPGNGIDDDQDGLVDCDDPDVSAKNVLLQALDASCNADGLDGSVDMTVSINEPYSYVWSDMIPTARWNFESSTSDVSGNEHNQIDSSGQMIYTMDCKEGNFGLYLNGNTYLRYSEDWSFMEVSFSKLTFAAWIKPDELVGYQTIFDEGSSSNGIALRLSGNLLDGAVRNGGVLVNPGTISIPNDDNWHHVALVFDEGAITVYLDGSPGTTVLAPFSSIGSHSGNGGLGFQDNGSAFGVGSGNFYKGKLDDVRYFFEKGLTNNQVRDLALNNGDRADLSVGDYTVTVSNANSCDTIIDFSIDGVLNYESAGIIGDDESHCIDYYSSTITFLTPPSGGFGGTPLYQWEKSIDDGIIWLEINDATADTYDPGLITSNSLFRVKTRRTTCSEWIISNQVSREIIVNLTSAGSISGDEILCGAYDPTLIISDQQATGGLGGAIEYQWQKSIDGGIIWTDILGAVAEIFDPSTITKTTFFRRLARRSYCNEWETSNIVSKIIIINYTSGGEIGENENICGAYDPAEITSISAPSGGSYGSLEYHWVESTDNGATWNLIAGANGASYDPGFINQDILFRRGARRMPCTNWIYSNVISKTLKSFPVGAILNAPSGILCEYDELSFEAEDSGPGVSLTWDFGTYATASNNFGKGPITVDYDIPSNAITTQDIILTIEENGCVIYDSTSISIRPNIEVTQTELVHPINCMENSGALIFHTALPPGENMNISIDGGASYGTLNQDTFINLTAGVYDVYVKYADGNCPLSIGNFSLDDPVQPNAVILQTYTEACTGEYLSFRAEWSWGSSSYTWDFGEGATPATASGRGTHYVYYDTGGPKSVALTVVRSGCENTDSRAFDVIENYSDGGTITGDEFVCPDVLPATILNSSSPTGGQLGVLEYRWEYRDSSIGAWSDWISIAGTNTASYTPTFFTGDYTQYRRKARRSVCTAWEVSNIVHKIPQVRPITNDDFFDPVCPGIPYTDNLMDNDVHVENPNLRLLSNPSNGTVEMYAEGDFIYIPYSSYCGVDSFKYEICNNSCCDTALVTLDMNDVQAPYLENIPDDVVINCDERIPLPPFVVANENCLSLNLGLDEITTQGQDNCSLFDYIVTRTWSTTDYCGNGTSASQVITIEDNTAPDIFRIYTLPNGKKMVAGVIENVTDRWKIIRLPIDFQSMPLVFAQVASQNEALAKAVRIKNISDSQFELKIQLEESKLFAPAFEKVAWIAIEKGSHFAMEEFDAGDIFIDNNWATYNFGSSFSQVPAAFVNMQSAIDSDPSIVRIDNLSNVGFDLYIEEEQSLNTDLTHATESVSVLAMSKGIIENDMGEAIGECNTISVDDSWQIVNLINKYHNPVVVANSLSFNDTMKATVRVKEITDRTFKIKIENWDYLPSDHDMEQISYIVIEGSIPFDASYDCDADYSPLQIGTELIAVDNCDNTIGFEVTETPNLTHCNEDNEIIRTWSVTDECGNNYTVSRIISIQDTIYPTFTVPMNVSISCNEDIDDLTLTGDVFDEWDNCSSDIEAVYSDNYSGELNCDSVMIINRIWTLSDECGNTTSQTQEITLMNSGISLYAKVYLQGALQDSPNSLMRDDLRALNLIPLVEPYTDHEHLHHFGSGGGETIEPEVLQVLGPDAIVDWVFVEMRHPLVLDSIIATRSVLLQRDGDIVDVDGYSPIRFPELNAGSYHVSVRHRNHLGAMTAITSVFTTGYTTKVDLLDHQSLSYGNFSRRYGSNGFALWGGDFNGDKRTINQGPVNDVFSLFYRVLTDPNNKNSNANYISMGYEMTDFDLDGQIIFQGPGNERNMILFNVVLSSPSNLSKIPNFMILEKLP